MVNVAVVQGMKVWHRDGLVTIAKCVVTGRFVKRAIAQAALDNALTPIIALPVNDSPFLQYASAASVVVMVASVTASVFSWLI